MHIPAEHGRAPKVQSTPSSVLAESPPLDSILHRSSVLKRRWQDETAVSTVSGSAVMVHSATMASRRPIRLMRLATDSYLVVEAGENTVATRSEPAL
jgi:hypothetical protein